MTKDRYRIGLLQNLKVVVRKKTQEDWEKENKKAIDAYNNDIAKNGVFSDGLRTF